MKTKTYIQSYVSPTMAVLSSIFILFGLFAFITGNVWGNMGIAVGAIGLSYRDGTEFMFKERKVREFYAIGPFRFGDWEDVHLDNELQLRHVTMAYTRSHGGLMSHTSKHKEMKLMIKVEGGKFIMVKLGDNLEKMEALQQEIMDGLS